jgi:t-SNARE complex subunit (syntaxin)
MFHDLSYLVQEQQVGIDVIENNITVAKQARFYVDSDLMHAP